MIEEIKTICYGSQGRCTKMTYNPGTRMIDIEQDLDGEYSFISVTRNELLHYIHYLEREKIDDDFRSHYKAYQIG